MTGFGVLLGRLILREREARGWIQRDLAMRAFNDPDKVRRISELENGKVASPRAKNFQPFCEALGITSDQIEALRAEAAGMVEEPVQTRMAKPEEPDFPMSDADRFAPWMETHTREVLDGLALRFGHEGPESVPLRDLKTFLISKAQDLKDLEAQISALPDPSGRIANVKAAAVEAIERNDLDEASQLVADALEIQHEVTMETLKQHAELVEVQARIALTRNDAQEAYRLYLNIVESFLSLDKDAFIDRCLAYQNPLYQHALRYGGQGLALSADLLTRALAHLSEADQPELWAKAQNNLGLALTEQGRRLSGAEGANLLVQAVTAYKAALSVWTEEAHPLDWARTQENLAILYLDRADHDSSTEVRLLLKKALAHVCDALKVYEPDSMPYNHEKATGLRDEIEARLAAL